MPIIGGHLTIWFGWQGMSFLMAGISVLVLFNLIVLFEESLSEEDPNAISISGLIFNFTEIITERNFIIFLLIVIGAYAGLYALLIGIAREMTVLLQPNTDVFGYQFVAIMVGHIISAGVAGKLINV
jgi:DHA1 family bicyclomycin/chloramphenicol resistance-like MFS transporter